MRGHADDIEQRELTNMESLNVECDSMAKTKLSQIAAHPILTYDPDLQHSGWMILLREMANSYGDAVDFIQQYPQGPSPSILGEKEVRYARTHTLGHRLDFCWLSFEEPFDQKTDLVG